MGFPVRPVAWQDYVALEQLDPHRIRVVTLRMVLERITEGWLLG